MTDTELKKGLLKLGRLAAEIERLKGVYKEYDFLLGSLVTEIVKRYGYPFPEPIYIPLRGKNWRLTCSNNIGGVIKVTTFKTAGVRNFDITEVP
jgi:hypothetical protein